MTEQEQQQLGNMLWQVADILLAGTPMDPDDFRDYMLSLLFLYYLSHNYTEIAKRELGSDLLTANAGTTLLKQWYEQQTDEATIEKFELMMQRKLYYTIKPEYLWDALAILAYRKDDKLLSTLEHSFKHIEEESFKSTLSGLFSEINLNSDKLGKDHNARNTVLCKIISRLATKLKQFQTDRDTLGDAYEYLIGKFAAGAGKKAGEFYTPQKISAILSKIVTLDCQDPKIGKKQHLESVLDFACGSGSLLLNVHREMGAGNIGTIYGQEKNITAYNLARMNMLLHGVNASTFHIYRGCSLKNEWDLLSNSTPQNQQYFDAIVSNPPFSLSYDSSADLADDSRFKNYGLAPKSYADFAFLLHGFNYLKDNGTMAIILPHGVLFRGGSERKIRKKLLDDGHIDTVIGLPENLFYSTGIPVCIVVLKKCTRADDILFINASEEFKSERRQNSLGQVHIDKIVSTYQNRIETEYYSRRVPLVEIKEQHDYNLNITRYVSTTRPSKPVDLDEVNSKLQSTRQDIKKHTEAHNRFLAEIGLAELP